MSRLPRPFLRSVALICGTLAALVACSTQTEVTHDDHNQPTRDETMPPALQKELADLREVNKRAGATYTVGFNSAALKPLEDLVGTIAPRDLTNRAMEQRVKGQEMYRLDIQARDQFVRAGAFNAVDILRIFPELTITCMADRAAWDWRRAGAVSPVKSQQCGNCWAYASAASLESSYLIRNSWLVDSSEQYIVNCAVDNSGNDAGTCGGGWHEGVFQYMIAHGVADDASEPDAGVDSACMTGLSFPYRAVAWDYVTTPAPAAGFGDSIPTVTALKQALCEHGPFAVAVLATRNFQLYTGNVFNESLPASTLTYTWSGNGLKYHAINHDVLLIGWDDSKHAWLIKNSWGADWGTNAGFGAATDKGFMWIDYNSNNIGLGAAWVQARHRAYRLPELYLEKFRPLIPFPDPGPLRFEDWDKQMMQRQ